MNPAHLHLLVNHLPIFGTLFALLLSGGALLLSPFRRGLFLGAVVLAVIGGIGGFVAENTGEGAEELVEDLPGVTETLIHAHEEAAETAAILGGLAAAVGIGLMVVGGRREQVPAWAPAGLALVSLMATGAMGYAGSTGGVIRHTEIRDGAPAAGGAEASEEGEEGEEEAPKPAALPVVPPAEALPGAPTPAAGVAVPAPGTQPALTHEQREAAEGKEENEKDEERK
jgi:hypothetical protein